MDFYSNKLVVYYEVAVDLLINLKLKIRSKVTPGLLGLTLRHKNRIAKICLIKIS